MKEVIYISGPMSGYEDFNFPAFNQAANRLRELGYPVINPADFGQSEGMSWRQCLVRDIAALVHCDAVATLPGYENSKGASLELDIARGLGLSIYSVQELTGV